MFLRHFFNYVAFILIWTISDNGYGAFFDSQGKISSEVVSLFRVLKPWIYEQNNGLDPESRISAEELSRAFQESPFLEDLNRVAQKFFLRPANAERTDLLGAPQDAFLETHREELLNLFREIGDLNTIKPKLSRYDYIFFNGSTVPNMRERLKTLTSYVDEGLLDLEHTKLVILTGKRVLFKTQEREWEKQALVNISQESLDPTWRKPLEMPTTEDEAMQWIWAQTNLPASLRRLTPVWIVAPQKWDQAGNPIRPNTLDTVEVFLKQENPEPATCLVLSSQPFVYYQQEVFKNALLQNGKAGFTLEGVGEEPGEEQIRKPGALKILLDNLARVLYEKQKEMILIRGRG